MTQTQETLQDKALREVFRRRAAGVPPLPEDFADRVMETMRVRRRRRLRKLWLWPAGIAAALLTACLLWPQEQPQQPGPVAQAVLAERVGQVAGEAQKPKEAERPNKANEPNRANRANGTQTPDKSADLDELALAEIYFAEEVLQVAYLLRESREALQTSLTDAADEDEEQEIIAI